MPCSWKGRSSQQAGPEGVPRCSCPGLWCPEGKAAEAMAEAQGPVWAGTGEGLLLHPQAHRCHCAVNSDRVGTGRQPLLLGTPSPEVFTPDQAIPRSLRRLHIWQEGVRVRIQTRKPAAVTDGQGAAHSARPTGAAAPRPRHPSSPLSVSLLAPAVCPHTVFREFLWWGEA